MLTTILFSILAATLSAIIATLLVRNGAESRIKSLEAEAQAKLDKAQASARSEANALQDQIHDLKEAKGKLEGELSATAIIAANVQKKESQIEELLREIAATKAELASANTRVVEVEQSTRRQLEEKQASLVAQLEEKQRSIDEQKVLLEEAKSKLSDTFEALSSKALGRASEEFLKTAKATFETSQATATGDLKLKQQAIEEMLKPIKESLTKLQEQHESIEVKRVSAFDAIEKSLIAVTQETDQLVNALRKPASRGAWGEMNLQVILNNAGLVEGVHYDLQCTTEDGEGIRRRTDVVIHLPKGRDFIIDSKTVIDAYMEGVNASDEATRNLKFKAHAAAVREHMKKLASKAYWAHYKSAPECVVMFIPVEGAFQAAIEADPTLIAEAQALRIYIANPMTIINMIHVTVHVLQEEVLRQDAQQIHSRASELYNRLCKFAGDFAAIGRNLRLTVEKYNDAVGSFDRRVLPAGREVKALNGSTVPEVKAVPAEVRSLASPEGKAQVNDQFAA